MKKLPKDIDQQGRWPREEPPRPISTVEKVLLFLIGAMVFVSLILQVEKI